MTATVRDAGFDDVDALLALMGEVQALHVENEPEFFRPFEPDEIRGWLIDYLDVEENGALIAERDGRAAGYLFWREVRRAATPFGPARHYLLIDQISVAENCRRQGIGQALMGRLREIARELGVEQLQTSHWGFNRESSAFFEAEGLRVTYLQRVGPVGF